MNLPEQITEKMTPDNATGVVEQILRGRKPATIKAYGKDLAHFARFIEANDAGEAIYMLVSQSHGVANQVADSYRSHMVDDQAAPATINRRLSTLRSMVSTCRKFGLVSWTLEVSNVRSETYRDTSGPGDEAYLQMLRTTEDVRDRAILRLLFDIALRRDEVCKLDLDDYQDRGDRKVLMVEDKGKSEKSPITLPQATQNAIDAWLSERGPKDGPLFLSIMHGAYQRSRMSGKAIHDLVGRAGRRIGIKASPHGLRHSGITRAAKVLNGDVVALKAFSRHSRVDTVIKYIDNLDDQQGSIAAMVADGIDQGDES